MMPGTWAACCRQGHARAMPARDALRDAGITQADWARAHYYEPGHWGGDACGCPDDRCIGYHHDASESCGCLGVLLDRYDGPRKARAL